MPRSRPADDLRLPLPRPGARSERSLLARLTRGVRGGDERAFEEIFRSYHQQIYRYCLAILHDTSDAEDALQATMAAALQALPGEQRSIELKPWLYRVAHNEAISILRRRRESPAPRDVPDLEHSAAETAEQRERVRTLVSDLNALGERHRGALVMRELAGLGYREIGASLECSEAAARQTVYEARVALKQRSEGRAMSCEETRRAISDGDGRRLRGRRLRAHLAACEHCQDFRAAIEARRGDLQALCPALPAAAAGGVLASLGGAASAGAAGGSAAAGGGVAAVGAGVGGAATSAAGAGLAAAGAVKGASIAAAVVVAVGAGEAAGVIDVPGPMDLGREQERVVSTPTAPDDAAKVAPGDEGPPGDAPAAGGREQAASRRGGRAAGKAPAASTRRADRGRSRARGQANGKAIGLEKAGTTVPPQSNGLGREGGQAQGGAGDSSGSRPPTVPAPPTKSPASNGGGAGQEPPATPPPPPKSNSPPASGNSQAGGPPSAKRPPQGTGRPAS